MTSSASLANPSARRRARAHYTVERVPAHRHLGVLQPDFGTEMADEQPTRFTLCPVTETSSARAFLSFSMDMMSEWGVSAPG